MLGYMPLMKLKRTEMRRLEHGDRNSVGNDGLDNYIDQVPLLDKKSRGLRNQASLFFAL